MLIILTNPNGTPLAQVELLRPGERSQADDLAWTAERWLPDVPVYQARRKDDGTVQVKQAYPREGEPQSLTPADFLNVLERLGRP